MKYIKENKRVSGVCVCVCVCVPNNPIIANFKKYQVQTQQLNMDVVCIVSVLHVHVGQVPSQLEVNSGLGRPARMTVCICTICPLAAKGKNTM